ncbi:MAG: hypothetical protein GX542_00385 [Rhodococcus sp.]|nr:hypothetical protein [Rhodococcus sp. (in: high G+C Gram-positive bacteria)]
MFSDRFIFLSPNVNVMAMGPWAIIIAASASFLGVAVAVAGVNKAVNTRSARTRIVWLSWSSISFGLVGSMGPTCLALVGFEVDGSRVRFDPVWLTAAAVVSVVGSALAFAALAPGTRRSQHISNSPRWGQLSLSVSLLAATLIGVHLLIVQSIQVQGKVYMLIPATALALVLAIVAAFATILAAQLLDTRSRRLLASVGITVALASIYFCGILGIDVVVNPAASVPEGFEMFAIALPGYAVLVLLMALPITSLLMAPDRVSAELEAEADELANESAHLEKVGS